MSVQQQTPYQAHIGNGVTTIFAFGWLLLKDTDLAVYVAGVLQAASAYTVSGVGQLNGGSVTFFVAPANGARVDLVRAMKRERVTDYQNLGDFNTAVVNPDFDRAILLAQDLHASLQRVVASPTNELGPLMTLPAQAVRAGKFIAMDASGQPIASVGTGNDSALRTDLASTTVANDGARLTGYRRMEAGSVARTVASVLDDVVSVLDFGADPTGAVDSLAAFTSALAASRRIVVPPGEYLVTDPITITLSDTRIETIGRPTIRSNDNANPVFFFDGGASSTNIFRCYLGDCILDGGSYGLRIRSCHRSEFHAAGKNHVTALLRTEFSVLNTFYLACTINDGAMSTVPTIGASLFRRGVGENTVANVFVNPIFEGIGLGLDFEDANSNVVINGSSEGNTTGGVRVRTGSTRNTFINHYCEVNGGTASNYDFRIQADQTKLINCTLASGGSNLGLWIEGGRGSQMEGGFLVNSQIDVAAERFKFIGVLKDSGTHTNNGVGTMELWTDADAVDFPRSRMDYLGAIAPSFSGTWANYGSGYASAGYFRDAFNVVHLQGTVFNGTAGTTIFTLDSGFRPTATRRYTSIGPAVADSIIIDILTNGNVNHIAGVVTQVPLDGIAFLAN